MLAKSVSAVIIISQTVFMAKKLGGAVIDLTIEF